MSQKDLSGRLGRWSLKLQAFDFEIEYRKGSANIVPDALFRQTELEKLVVPSIASEVDLESEYFSSVEYNVLRTKISQNSHNFPDTCISDGFIYHRVKFRKGEMDDDQSLWRLWLPVEMRRSVIENNHIVNSCHGGYAKTLNRVREKYFWPKMAGEIKTYVSSCELCRAVKPTNITLRPPDENRSSFSEPLYMDLLSPYPRTNLGNNMIFVALDHFSIYIFLKPLKKFYHFCHYFIYRGRYIS